MYAAKGCIAYSIEEANEVYAKMFKTKKINKSGSVVHEFSKI